MNAARFYAFWCDVCDEEGCFRTADERNRVADRHADSTGHDVTVYITERLIKDV